MAKEQKEPMKADIIVVVSGGVVQSIQKPIGPSMAIRDYDVDDEAPNNPDCRQDENGEWFHEWFLPAHSRGDFMD